jgi:protoporphyrinogen/coproporphyrinogen III oxidase
MNGRPRVAVVGAGSAGLTAAHHLQQGGAEAVVFESRAWIGGRTRTDVIDGYHVDTYAQSFGSMHTETLRLLHETGVQERAVRMPGRDALWRNGRSHEIVYGSITSMLATGAVPMTTKLVLGTKYLRFLDQNARHLDLQSLERAAEAGLDRESIADWGRRELGEDFVEYLAYPLLASFCGVEPERITAALYHALARSGTDVTMYALEGGMGALVERLAEGVREGGGEVRVSSHVRRVEAGQGHVTVEGDGFSDTFDGAVLAVPGVEVPSLVGGLNPAARAWFDGVRYQPLASLALLLHEPVGARYFGLSFPRSESRIIATACIQENKAGSLVPPGRGLLVIFPAPEAVPLFLESEPERVIAAVLTDLERAMPGLRNGVRRAKLYRWPIGGPVFYPGYLQHLAAFGGGAVEAAGRLAFAGDYLAVPSTEGSILSGRRAADRLLPRLSD